MESYTKCDCGSGEKYKFCCQKAEIYTERIDRQIESKQLKAAMATIEEGLRKYPDTPVLILRKAMISTLTGEGSHASQILEAYLAKHPKHSGMRHFLLLNALESEGPEAASLELQRFMTQLSDEQKAYMANLPSEVATAFEQIGKTMAAQAHAILGVVWAQGKSNSIQRLLTIQQNPNTSPWLRNPYPLILASEEIAPGIRDAFAEAYELAMAGCWLDSADAFADIAAKDPSGKSFYNQGLLLAWIGDNAGAVHSLRNYIRIAGETTESVDLEALCQDLEFQVPYDEELVDRIQLTWPIRSHDMLIENLNKSNLFLSFKPVDNQGKPLEVVGQHFVAVDKPRIENAEDLRSENVPCVIANVVVDEKNVSLNALDDGDLDKTTELFRDAAGAAIVPAHPRTKHLGKEPKPDPLRQKRWVLPEGISKAQSDSFFHDKFKKDLETIWLDLPQGFLGRKTPRQAAAAGKSTIALRAALLRFRIEHGNQVDLDVIEKARKQLNVAEEPVPDPESLAKLHISRLGMVDPKALSDEQLVMLFEKGLNFFALNVVEKAGNEWLSRPVGDDKDAKSRVRVYRELASVATSQQDLAKALDLLAEGRKYDTEPNIDLKDITWSLAELRARAMLSEPTQWVPYLAIILDRKRPSQNADQITQTMIMGLIDLGLIRVVRNPQQPDQSQLDTRILEMLLQQYGPKIKTASGELGVSASKGGIWTPGQSAAAPAGGGKIWTPGQSGGSNPPQAGGESGPKLFVPGR